MFQHVPTCSNHTWHPMIQKNWWTNVQIPQHRTEPWLATSHVRSLSFWGAQRGWSRHSNGQIWGELCIWCWRLKVDVWIITFPLTSIDLHWFVIWNDWSIVRILMFLYMVLSTRLPSGHKIPVEHSAGLWLFPLCAAVLCRTPLWSTGADLEMQHDATISTISFRVFFWIRQDDARWCKMMQNV